MTKGDRVKFSREWLSQWHYTPKTPHALWRGVCRGIDSGGLVMVRWDHQKRIPRYHPSFIIKDYSV